jgi:hypothetical protein
MDPKVNPVAIRSVVYARSCGGIRKDAAVGYTPTSLVVIFTRKSRPMTPAPEARAGAEMSVPACRKKNGLRRAKAMERTRSTRVRSWMKTPATTSPQT